MKVDEQLQDALRVACSVEARLMQIVDHVPLPPLPAVQSGLWPSQKK